MTHPNTQNTFTLHQNPNKALQDMIETIDLLHEIYTLETKALETSDTKSFLAIQEQKLCSADRYAQGVEQLIARKEEMKKANPELKERLREMQNEFSILADKNQKALKRMQRCTKRLGDTIRSAAKKAVQQTRSTSYSETGSLHKNENKSISMGINETA